MTKNPISVRVRFFGGLVMYARAPEINLEIEKGCDLNWLLDHLLEINPPAYGGLMKKNSDRESFLRVMLNDSLVNEKDFSLVLSNNDQITLLPAISGGDGPSVSTA